ncbi:ankyrin repeat domain-containing protein [Amycolatopsis pithecellobii]|uniref:Ankyrin repeat domain-containing protein n=1 Tax=Amycolatopsis pithecellobii TaxID=664692 RepID=A0A6N7ZA00_9PSEU|nr:ankyrin repeat domain-containing protein [Amycolatopsis pithecellobii]MTD58550.1 ankyrin repeat domain-containing protein [Amycolatopsis pithecellobii]
MSDEASDADLLNPTARAFVLAREGNAQLLGTYVDGGVPLDATNDRGDTLLMLAAYHGNTEAVRVLLDRGADPNQLTEHGQSPLAAAVFKNATDIVKALVAKGADPETGAPSALEAAQMFGNTGLLTLLQP